nr:hypothetical protein [Iningainema tapete]
MLGLEISKGELRRLTGFAPDTIMRRSLMSDRHQRSKFLGNEIVVTLVLTAIIVGVIYALIIRPTIGQSTELFIILLIVVAIAVLSVRWLRRRLTYSRLLTTLLEQVDKYHAILWSLNSIDENQQSMSDRDKVITALQLVREDLVRALKIERIVRDNKRLLSNNQELFANNLTNLQTLQVSSQTEYAQLLNQSLQIALDVQAQIKKLQSHP